MTKVETLHVSLMRLSWSRDMSKMKLANQDAVEIKKQEIDIMYVPLAQAVMPKELVRPSRTAILREEAPDAKGHYP